MEIELKKERRLPNKYFLIEEIFNKNKTINDLFKYTKFIPKTLN